jgi:primosomal protein N' (replication factor Y)
VLLFLNRRGYASVIYCLDCGWVASCSRCAIGFTYHQGQNRLRCHRCGVSRPLHPECPECGGERLMPLGKGTERVELALKTRFPEQVIARIDRDTARSSKAFEEVMSEVRERKVDILVGTQMLAKGHHLPGIGLAAIVDMDSALYSLDFRSLERAGQMVTQVFGRSGRGDSQGRVMIQTSSPEHPMLQLLLNEGYAPFAQKLLQERSEALLPPYSFQVLIRAQAHRLEQVERFLKEVRGRVAAMRVAEVECYGPMVGGIEKSAGFHHRLLVMHAPRRSPLHAVLRSLVQQLDLSTTMRSVRWHIDVDPQEMG